MSDLPEGFTLDQPTNQQAANSALPAGFTIDHPSMWQDTVNSIGSGLERGTATAIGLPGNIAGLAHQYAPQGVTDAIKSVPGAKWLYNHLPTSQAVLDSASDPLVDPNYQPQYAGNRYTQAIASAAGPGLATGMGVGATIGSAVGGQAASDLTGGNRAAEFIGSLAGGGFPALVSANRAMRAASAAAPLRTIADVKSEATAGYNSPAVKDLQITSQSVRDLGDRIENDLIQNRGFDDTNNAPVFRINDRLASRPNSPVSFDELHNVRTAFKNIAKERQGDGSLTPNAVAAVQAIDHIDDFVQNRMLNPGNVIQGNPQAAAQILQTADANWGAMKRAGQVKMLLDDAARAAARRDSGDNLGNAVRGQLDTLLQKNARRAQGFNDAEKQSVTGVVEGTGGLNFARSAANLARNPFLVAGHAIVSPMSAALQYGIATGAKRLVGHITEQRARAVQEALLSRAPAYQQALAARRALMAKAAAQPTGWNPYGAAIIGSNNNNGSP